MIDLAISNDPATLEILRRHPRVLNVEEGSSPDLEFRQGTWARRVAVGQPNMESAGLMDQLDNNPLVCADEASVPDCASTLALIGLVPLINAGILAEPPTVLVSFEADQPILDAFLAKHHWPSGATLAATSLGLGTVCAATVIAAIQTPENLHDLDALYAEAYGRSFFVHRQEEGDWDVKAVAGTASALYRLRVAPDSPQSLLTILVMADRHGKCGAAQMVHCMNLMAGFEESLGIA